MLKLAQIVFTVIQFIFNLFHTAKHRLTPKNGLPPKGCREPVLLVFSNTQPGSHISPSPYCLCHFSYYLSGSLLWQHIFLARI